MEVAAPFINPSAQADDHPTAERDSLLGGGRF